jgi:hypothetical protein
MQECKWGLAFVHFCIVASCIQADVFQRPALTGGALISYFAILRYNVMRDH